MWCGRREGAIGTIGRRDSALVADKLLLLNSDIQNADPAKNPPPKRGKIVLIRPSVRWTATTLAAENGKPSVFMSSASAQNHPVRSIDRIGRGRTPMCFTIFFFCFGFAFQSTLFRLRSPNRNGHRFGLSILPSMTGDDGAR